ncbi:MAG: GDP-mannose 4,6-dehydratase [Candidatus Hodarchaeales archaeon]
MKVLVTGGAGFVGSHLIEELLSIGASVVCFDDFSTGKRENLEHIKNKITIIEGDIRNPDIVRTALDNVEQVYHLAAQISVTNSVRNPLLDATININGWIYYIIECNSEKLCEEDCICIHGRGHLWRT